MIFLNVVNVFLLFHYNILLKKVVALHLDKLESSLSKNSLCQVWLKLAHWSRRIYFRPPLYGWSTADTAKTPNWSIFLLLCYYLPLKMAGAFICKNLNLIHPRMHNTKFGWNWPCGSGVNLSLYFVNVFLLSRYYLPMEKGMALTLNKLKFSSSKNTYCQVGQNFPFGFGEDVNEFRYYLPLEKDVALHI